MRILFVSPLFPMDFSKSVYGGFQRMRMWLDAMISLGADLDILFLRGSANRTNQTAPEVALKLNDLWGIRANVVICDGNPEERHANIYAKYVAHYLRPALGISQHYDFRPFLEAVQRDAFARCLERSPDIIFFHSLHGTSPALSMDLSRCRVLLDIDNIEHRRFAREVGQTSRWMCKPLLYMQVPALWWAERAAIVRSKHAFVCSLSDRNYLQRSMRVPNVEVVPNAVPRVADRLLTKSPNVLFIGAYSHTPNVVAAEYLVRKVWPHLVNLYPKAKLFIAGPRSERLPGIHNPPIGVKYLGFVSDLDALYRKTRVVCCPIQSGGGTRIKILEAAGYGIPVVSTRIGAEGLDLMPDREIIIRNNPTDIAAACARLLANDKHAKQIGTSARKIVRTLYDRTAIVGQMRALLVGNVVSNNRKTSPPVTGAPFYRTSESQNAEP
jgi:glycosyltransferase involved in cell wall biosynthesis